MSKRDAYIDKMKAQIDLWNAEIERFEAKAYKAEADARVQYEEELARLRQRREQMQQHLVHLQESGEEAFERLRSGAEAAWDEMSRAFQEAMRKFR